MPIYVNAGGVWSEGKPYINVAGAWKLAKEAWVNISGIWKRLWATNTWVARAPMPTARNGAAAASPGNNKIYVFGGYNGVSPYNVNANEEYDIMSNTWTTKASMPLSLSGHAAASPGNGKVYSIGGEDPDDYSHNYEYNPATNSWTQISDMPGPQELAAAVSLGNGKIYSIGGWDVNARTPSPNGYTLEYDVVTDTWTQKANMLTARRSLGAASPGNGKIYAVGGSTGSVLMPTPSNANEEYDPATNTWTAKAPAPTSGDCDAASPGNGKVYKISPSATEEYDPNTNTWAVKAQIPVSGMPGCIAVGKNGKIYAFGGYADSIYLANVQEYTPDS
ncbi:MAG: hypothetical protein HPY52_11050 [Firmicutes bacterium]|nr:hypothetical protein [Bacillota bacterium]